jgi:Family of unknown function (DUF6049)
MQTVRCVLRALGAFTAVLLAAGGPLLAGAPAARAAVGQFQQQAVTTSAVAPSSAVSQPLAISITGMTPTVPGPNSTITVTGTLANHTGAALPGIAVQAWTSTQPFQYPDQMTEFSDGTATGSSALPLQQAGEQYQVPTAVPNGATVRWSVSFPAGDFYGQFGVFPVQVQASAAGIAYTAAASTFLPFWPGSEGATQPPGLQTAWVWPLIDTPQQGICPQTLATPELASSVASGGRLNTLLAAGSAWAQDDDLTWDIDPALLSDVSVMTKAYSTGGNAACSGRSDEQPSKPASAWLSQLKTTTAGAPAFLAPYADVDVAALSHAGLDGNDGIESAYQIGDTVAGQILPGTFGKNGTGTGNGAVLKAAWPADGEADAGVLTSLAQYAGIGTVVLSSDEVSSSSPEEDALARTVSGVGTSMSLLLANSRITSLLGTASPTATEAGQFALTQDFLAQTAMIAAETDTSRSLVIAPPSNWNPSPAEANALLKITHDAPWLHSTGLSALSAAAAQLPTVTHVTPKQVSGNELNDTYIDYLTTKVIPNVNLFKDLLYQPLPQQLDSLTAALAVTESSAWRGRGSPGGWLAAVNLYDSLTDAEHKVQLIASKKILLAGQSGETPVSVQNGLKVPVQVRVTASTPAGSGLQVGPFNALLTVQGGKSNTVTMPVHSATIGTTTLQLQLATQNGLRLTGPGASQPLSVEVTRFGRSLLIIIGAALGILVLTSAYRLRRKRLARARNGGTADETADAGGAG